MRLHQRGIIQAKRFCETKNAENCIMYNYLLLADSHIIAKCIPGFEARNSRFYSIVKSHTTVTPPWYKPLLLHRIRTDPTRTPTIRTHAQNCKMRVVNQWILHVTSIRSAAIFWCEISQYSTPRNNCNLSHFAVAHYIIKRITLKFTYPVHCKRYRLK